MDVLHSQCVGDQLPCKTLQALLDIDYRGYLTFELDARAAVRSGVIPAEARDDPTPFLMEEAIQNLRLLESRLEGI